MKKFSLIVTLLLAVLVLQKCTKDPYSATAQSSNLFFAIINDTTWNADTVKASITYNSASNTKVLSCSAVGSNKKLLMSVTQTVNVYNSAGFPINTAFNADAAGNNKFVYQTLQKNAQGDLVYMPLGTVAPGSGTLTVSSVDSVKKVISGTFSYTSVLNNYDNNGNVISVTVSNITAGAFNNMPYTFTSN
jgi:hypothetical protein